MTSQTRFSPLIVAELMMKSCRGALVSPKSIQAAGACAQLLVAPRQAARQGQSCILDRAARQ